MIVLVTLFGCILVVGVGWLGLDWVNFFLWEAFFTSLPVEAWDLVLLVLSNYERLRIAVAVSFWFSFHSVRGLLTLFG